MALQDAAAARANMAAATRGLHSATRAAVQRDAGGPHSSVAEVSPIREIEWLDGEGQLGGVEAEAAHAALGVVAELQHDLFAAGDAWRASATRVRPASPPCIADACLCCDGGNGPSAWTCSSPRPAASRNHSVTAASVCTHFWTVQLEPASVRDKPVRTVLCVWPGWCDICGVTAARMPLHRVAFPVSGGHSFWAVEGLP